MWPKFTEDRGGYIEQILRKKPDAIITDSRYNGMKNDIPTKTK